MKNTSSYSLLFFTVWPDIKKFGLSLKKYYYNYNIEFLNNEDFHFKDFYPEKTIIFCDTDELIDKAGRTGLPVVAVSHPFNRKESLFGTPFMIQLKDGYFPGHLLSPSFLDKIYCRHYHLPLLIAESTHFRLRELTMEDLGDLIALDQENILDNDALFFPEEYLVSGLRDLHCEIFLKNYISNQYAFFDIGFYAVIDKKSGDFIGLVGFNTPEDDYIEIGYSLRKKYRHQGTGTEVLPGLLAYFRSMYPSLPVRITHKKDNIASRKLAEKFGIQCLVH